MTILTAITLFTIWIGLIALEWRVTKAGMGNPYHGYGAVDGTLTRTNQAPMRYRVLVPWLLRPVPHRWRFEGYLLLKWILMGFCLWAAFPLVGPGGVVVLAVLMATTFEYDYWDCYAELLGVCLCLTGEPGWAYIGAALWGLSKETVPLAMPLAFLAGGSWAGLAAGSGVAILILVRMSQGKARLYEGRWTLRTARLRQIRVLSWPLWKKTAAWIMVAIVGPYNADDLAAMRTNRDPMPPVSLVWIVVALLIALLGNLPPVFQSTVWVMLAWPLAALTLVRVRETRVLLPVALWLVGGLA